MIESTSKFHVHDIVYDKGGFAVARGYWEDDKKVLRLACRWHDEGVGYPQTFGKPQWMLFPDRGIDVELLNALDPLDQRKIVITLDARNLAEQCSVPPRPGRGH